MKQIFHLRLIAGGVIDTNNYWYSDGKLQSSGRYIDGRADQWNGTYVGTDGRLIASGLRNVFDPNNPTFNPQAAPAPSGGKKGGKK